MLETVNDPGRTVFLSSECYSFYLVQSWLSSRFCTINLQFPGCVIATKTFPTFTLPLYYASFHERYVLVLFYVIFLWRRTHGFVGKESKYASKRILSLACLEV